MEPEVKPPTTTERRRYNATRRQEAAARTRLAIVDAARYLFLERGYSGTTMPAIAEHAGVAVDTVYATIGPKPALFRLLIELAISGESDAVPAPQRTYVQEIHAEPDPRRKIERYARAVREIRSRMDPLFAILRDAARHEPDLLAVWNDISERRARNMRLFVADVAAAAGGLRDGITLDEAADIIWATNAPEFYLLLVHDRGWSPDQFEHWLIEIWTRTLLR